eukprot:TRINITY_DN27242_c0_g1_i1.p1 TRINITY_DN27242_c0_g1~~TRINITY_DN27242_c0_g1_i1.p1  ORF type:complete len:1025 (+),score=370.48 TRINITY_DN27242_c0_g1_i1:33-3107(+)
MYRVVSARASLRRAAPAMSSVAKTFAPIAPANNTLQYKGLVLDNGLTVLLVQSDEKEKGSAALSVARGHLSDPWDCPGTAHFVEHMLFLGTEKYPEEGEYKLYLKGHGGSCNAMTSPDTTQYHFTVASDYFEGAVDRFLQFFLSPTFDESSTARELNAIESEFQKNVLSDPKRIYYLLKHMADPQHVFAKFGSGNLKSLKEEPEARGVCPRDRLLAFYKEHYSASLMSLVLRSDRPIAEMEKWVVEGFSKIQNRHTAATQRKRIDWDGVPFPPARLGRVARFKPLGKRQELIAYFPYAAVADTERGNSSKDLLSHLVGHEGPGSLCLALRKRGLITDLVAGNAIKDNYGYFSVTFVLTAEGRAAPFTVLGELFAYVAMVKDREGEAPRVWAEQRQCSQINFDHAPKRASKDCATRCAMNLRYADTPEECLSRGLWGDFDRGVFMAAVRDVRSENMLVFLTDPEPGAAGPVAESPYWGVEHTVSEFTDAEAAAMSAATGSYAMPPLNPYIPSDLAVLPACPSRRDQPVVVHRDHSVVTWWHQDALYATPKLFLSAYLDATGVQTSAMDQRALVVYVAVLNMTLSEKYYDALYTCHPWSVSAELSSNAVLLHVNGFADKLVDLFLGMLSDVLEGGVSRTDFDAVHQRMLRDIETREATLKSDQLAARALMEVTTHNFTPLAQSDAALRALTFEDMEAFLAMFRASLSLQIFLHGNVTLPEAAAASRAASEVLAAKQCSTAVGGGFARRVVSLKDAASHQEHRVLTHLPNPKNTESCVIVHYQMGVWTPALRARCKVLQQLLSPRFFTELRTKQQLGYSVSSMARIHTTELAFRFVVRSGVVPPLEIHRRIDAFLEAFGAELEALDDAAVTGAIESAKDAVLQPSANLNEEHWKLLPEIRQERYSWDFPQVMHAELSKLTKQDLIDLYRHYIHAAPAGEAPPAPAPARRVVAAYNYCDAHAEAELAETTAAATRHAADGTVFDVVNVDPTVPEAFLATMPLLPAKHLGDPACACLVAHADPEVGVSH